MGSVRGLLVAGFAVLVCVSGGSADAHSSAAHPVAGHPGHIGVTVPRQRTGGVTPAAAVRGARARARSAASSAPTIAGQLVYHHGPVMQTNTVHVMYWIPAGYSMSGTMTSEIDGFLGGVAAASGTQGNVFADTTQYGVGYDATFGGSAVDTNSYPTSGCSAIPVGGTECLTEQQIFTELERFASSQGWSGDSGDPAAHPTNLFLVYLPVGVADCFDSNEVPAGSFVPCSANLTSLDPNGSYYCAYHTAWADSNTNQTFVWGNMPATWDLDGCAGGHYPNDPFADTAVNVTSHEYIEALTDPYLNAWYDASGYEVADKCQESYGDTLDVTSNDSANQLIGANAYWIQLEYSNQLKSCFQVGKPTITGVTHTSPNTASITGTNLYFSDDIASSEGVAFNGHKSPTAFTQGLASSPATATIPDVAGTAGKVTLTAVGGSAASAQSFTGLTPTVTSLSDPHDVTGTKITVNGTGFFGVTSVKIGGVPGSFSSVATDGTSLKVIVPAGAVTGNVTVTTSGGTSSDSVPFTVTPRITSFTPAKAAGLANVTINGTGLGGATEVDFGGGASSSPASSTATKIVAQVPADATPGPLTVKNGTDTVQSAASFTPLPVISSIGPLDGDTNTTVTITGGELQDATAVKFGTVLQPTFTPTATSITAKPPAGFSTGKITVVTPEGTAVSKQTFSITKVTSVTPTAAADATITIGGQGLGDVATVDFNGHPAQPVSGTPTATSVKVVVPGDALDGPVTVNTPNTSAASPKPFKPLPRITGFDMPAYKVGDTVTVTGTNLSVAGPVSAKVGAVSVTPTVDSATQMHFTLPNAALTGVLSYKDAAGSTTSGRSLVRVLPTIIGDPAPNESTVGSTITISGMSFLGTTSVKFGADTNKASFVIGNGGTTLTVKVPATATSGKIFITNAGGTALTTNDFTLDPVVTSFTPTSGPTGTTLTVTGTGFTNADDVSFTGGGTDATPANVTATSLKVVVPPGTLDGGIQVTTGTGGVYASSATSATSFHATMTAYTFTPKVADYGAQISIVGAGLTGVTEVDFNGVPGTNLNVSDDQDLTVDVPAGGDVNGPVTLKNGGTTITAGGGNFTVTPLAVSSLSDSAGLVGAPITITGTGFVEVTGVSFGGVSATYYHVDSDTQITTVVPAGAVTGTVTVATSNGNASSSTFTVESDPSSSTLFINEVAPAMDVAPYGFVELYSTTGAGSLDLDGVKLVYVPGTATGPQDELNFVFQQGAILNGSGFVDLLGMQQLSGSGGVLVAVLPDGTTLASVAWGTIGTFAASQGGNGTPASAPALDHSIALSPDGHVTGNDNTDYQVTSTPTPDASNSITP